MAEPANTPVPASTPRSASPVHNPHALPLSPTHFAALNLTQERPYRPSVLLLGELPAHNPELVAVFRTQFKILQPTAAERDRTAFVSALREGRWGDFQAIVRPAWGSGAEMGKWDEEIIGSLPTTVRVFAGPGAGFDMIETKLLGQRGIIYCNSGLAAAEAVADFAVALIISTFRHLPWCMSATADPAAFSSCHRDAVHHSRELRGQALGLVGFGNVGQQIAKRCHHGFGMKIHFYDIVPKPTELVSSFNATTHDSLESLIRHSDCVVLCRPGAVEPIINAKTLTQFRRGSCLVNVARGSLVDEQALYEALKHDHLSAVALDVHSNEPNVHQGLKQMMSEGRAMLTCHNAGETAGAHAGFESLSLRNVMAVLGGQEPITPVNLGDLR